MALPTSKRGDRAMEFMLVNSYPHDAPMLYTRFHVSPKLKCLHINCLEAATLVPNEQEFCLPPFSSFLAKELQLIEDFGTSYWQLDVNVMPDNRAKSQKGQIPDNCPCPQYGQHTGQQYARQYA